MLTFLIDTAYIVIYSWNFIILYFLFHGLHLATTLRVLNPVLCLHMTLFNQGAKAGVRDEDHTCRYHQSNIMRDSILSVIVCIYVCVFSSDILSSFYS